MLAVLYHRFPTLSIGKRKFFRNFSRINGLRIPEELKLFGDSYIHLNISAATAPKTVPIIPVIMQPIIILL